MAQCENPVGRSEAFAILSLCMILSLIKYAVALNVSYDHRALLLDGKRRLLISAGIHYPRATPEMWPQLISQAKEGGANVVQTYVFWSGHEPERRQYNFEGRYNLAKFVKLVGDAGLYFNLRIGPYVCAEWNFGGFPVWLRDVPGIEFRTDNEPFKIEMEIFVRLIVNLMKKEKLFSWQGGPIILAQIENEYGNIEWSFGEPGRQYMKWAARMAESLNAGVPWIMCQQDDAPSSIINTCNGFYCDGWKPNALGKPTMWTEDWNGWFQTWGGKVPHRPVEDNAFAVARFYQRGGSFQNYYMYFGGTNFERTAGGPFITTSYDYDAPIDEYGLLRQPKWGHLKDLHAALNLCEPALMAVDGEPLYLKLGPAQEAHVYAAAGEGVSMDNIRKSKLCAAFLANIDSQSSAKVHFDGNTYDLPAWSVSILPDCKHVAFNTAKVVAQTSLMRMKRVSLPPHLSLPNQIQSKSMIFQWESCQEPVGVRDRGISARSLLDQISTTKDKTDYLWYTTRVQVSEEDLQVLRMTNTQAELVIDAVRDAVHIFVNGGLAGSATGSWYISVRQKVDLRAGDNEIAILCMTVGLQNYGAFLEKDGAGIQGSVYLRGLSSGDKDLSDTEWVYQVGLWGEESKIFSDKDVGRAQWIPATAPTLDTPLVWYKTNFDAPGGKDPVALYLGSMGKGQAWVNGHHLGRFWSSLHAAAKGCSDTCDYRGPYDNNKCMTNCGLPTQQWFHVPRAWVQPTSNLLVIFEEVGGDPFAVSVGTRLQDMVCAHIPDAHPPPVDMWIKPNSREPGSGLEESYAEMRLECTGGQILAQISFASFGNPAGICGNFEKGMCHSQLSSTVVEKACLGKTKCSLTVSSGTFGEDSCPGIPKSLAVQALCRHLDESAGESVTYSEHYTPWANRTHHWQYIEPTEYLIMRNQAQRSSVYKT